jgi:hypothetical protein
VATEDAQQRATEFLKELYAAGDIDEAGFDAGVTGLLAARTEAELAEVVRSLPPPVPLTSPDRRLTRPLEIHSGIGWALWRPLRMTEMAGCQGDAHQRGPGQRADRPHPG